MSQKDVLLYEKTGKIGRVIINRPKARNAFNQELVENLGEFIVGGSGSGHERDCNQRRG